MPVRTAYAGTVAALNVYTAANHARMPGGWIGYDEVTAAQAGITTITDLTGLTRAVVMTSLRRIRISALAIITRTVLDGLSTLSIREGSTTLGIIQCQPGNTNGETYWCSVILTPTIATHTYKLSLDRTTGTGTTGIAASATAPTFILIEDLGPAT